MKPFREESRGSIAKLESRMDKLSQTNDDLRDHLSTTREELEQRERYIDPLNQQLVIMSSASREHVHQPGTTQAEPETSITSITSTTQPDDTAPASQCAPAQTRLRTARPDPSHHNIALPDQAHHNTALPDPAHHNTALLDPARHNTALLDPARHNTALLDPAHHNTALPTTPGPARGQGRRIAPFAVTATAAPNPPQSSPSQAAPPGPGQQGAVKQAGGPGSDPGVAESGTRLAPQPQALVPQDPADPL
ncbi:unnamed protein product, partial [Coregonus sp. 'balchen']